MDRTCSAEGSLGTGDRGRLLEIGRASIAHGLSCGQALEPGLDGCSSALTALRACFVTLDKDGELRGCVGTLAARLPLVCEVARSAFGAAFRDPRFAPLGQGELGRLELHISVLSVAEALVVASEAELVAQLRPGVDGITLREGGRSGTFLPAVWGKIGEPRRFLDQLRLKMGLPAGYWSETLQVERYTTESFS